MKKQLIFIIAGILLPVITRHADAGLIANWEMNDNAPNTIVTETVGLPGNTGTAQQNTSLMHIESGTPPYLNSALSFNGSSDVINCGNSTSLSNFTAKTILLWFKAESFTGTNRYMYYDSYYKTGNGDYIRLESTANRVYIALKNSAGTSAYEYFDFSTNTWNMVGYAWDGSNATYYYNGKAMASDSFSGTLVCNGGDLTLGAAGASSFFNGDLDDVRIYNTALTSEEIRDLYIETMTLDDLVGHWKLDDNGTSTTVLDSSGLRQNGIAARNTDLIHTNSGLTRLNGAFLFNGSSDSVNFGKNIPLQDFTNKTVLLWVNTPTAHTGSSRYIYYASYWSSSSYGDYIRMEPSTDYLAFGLRNTNNTSTAIKTMSIPDNKWIMVGYSWDGANVVFYSNAVPIATSAFTGVLGCSAVDLQLGVAGSAGYYNGGIDDVRIYRKALTTSEIEFIYERSFTRGTTIIIK